MNLFGEQESKVVNVSSIPQRSPFRYPGGKTWLIPVVRKWLKQKGVVPRMFEPFLGGGIVSLTAAFENLADQIIMVEKDDEVAAVWHLLTGDDHRWLAEKILRFPMTAENVLAEFSNLNKSLRDQAFCTILKNRTFHGGIITKGSGFLKHGENGKGILSRWYPETLFRRIIDIGLINHKLTFIEGNAFQIMNENCNDTQAFFFIDPPYTKAGKRLYTHFDIDHESLFEATSQLQGHYMLTYDDTPQVREWVLQFRMDFRTIPMKTTHHLEKNEIIICDNFEWW